MSNFKTVSKAELAEKLGVSERTLRRWLNVLHYDQMKTVGYRKNQKLLLPKQVDFILNGFGTVPDND